MSKCRAIWLGTKVDEELVVDLQAAFHVVHIHLHNVPGTNEPSQTSDKSLLNVSFLCSQHAWPPPGLTGGAVTAVINRCLLITTAHQDFGIWH